jgi:hypothetical protein
MAPQPIADESNGWVEVPSFGDRNGTHVGLPTCPRCHKPKHCNYPSLHNSRTLVCWACYSTECDEKSGVIAPWRGPPYWHPPYALFVTNDVPQPDINSIMSTEPSTDSRTDDFESQLNDAAPNLVAEFWLLLRHNKKWWLLPIAMVLLLIGAIVVLGGSAAAPFIYTLF